MAKKSRMTRSVVISIRQKRGPMSSYWNAVVRRGAKGPVLFENMDASRAVALAGAENWCRRLGFDFRIKEDA